MKQPVLKFLTQAALESKSVDELKRFINNVSIDSEYFQSNNLSKKEAEMIVKEYGNTLENNSPLPQTVSDTKNLPYSKDIIKKAIIVCIQNTSDEKMKENLKDGYTLLANWQDNVGDEDIGINLLNKDLDSGDTSQHIRDFQEQFRKYGEWKPLVESEEKELYRELQELGYH